MSKNVPVRSVKAIESFFEGQEDNLAALLPKDMKLDFMRANVIAAVSANPKLLECTSSSLFQAIFEACELGLLVHSSIGESWIVPYKNKATFIPGYQGLVKLAYQGGFLRLVESRAVYSNDDFRIRYGLNPELHLVETDGHRGALRGVYCKAELTTGGVLFDYFRIDQLEEIRERSASWRYKGDKHEIWGNPHNTVEMYRKAVWRNMSKWIPRSGSRYALALEIDDRQYTDYYDLTHDAEERLYESVGAGTSGKKKTDVLKKENIKDEYPLLWLIDELPDIIGLVFSTVNLNGEIEWCDLKYDELDEKQKSHLYSILKRAESQLVGKKLSEDEGKVRLDNFFDYCIEWTILLTNTRSLDKARMRYVEFEKTLS